jgi:hypothetical protein
MAGLSIKWQSKLFPKLILTEEHYQEMRKLFVNIESFKVEMEKAEKFYWANPEKQPKSQWKRAVSNWMRIADDIAKRQRAQRLVKGKEKPLSHKDATRSLAQIMGVEKPTEAAVKPFTCSKCTRVHSPYFNCNTTSPSGRAGEGS